MDGNDNAPSFDRPARNDGAAPRLRVPRLGETVLLLGDGPDTPAIVTKVYGFEGDFVNLFVIPDMAKPYGAASVPRERSLHHQPNAPCWAFDVDAKH